MAATLAQLVERSFTSPLIHGSNPHAMSVVLKNQI